MNAPSKSQKNDVFFLMFLWSIACIILFTGINNVVYNWIYLERIYDKPFNHWALAKPEMFLGYWRWVPGKVLCIVNVIVGVIPFMLWPILKRRT